MKLYMLLMGSKPKGRLTEQHDVCFVIANSLKESVPQIKKAWPEAKGKIHLDAWREVTMVDEFEISLSAEKTEAPQLQLFFINLGGYQPEEFDERHFKLLVVAADMDAAKKQARSVEFYKKNLLAHVDDKYSLDVDDIFSVQEILAEQLQGYQILIQPAKKEGKDLVRNGYFQIEKLKPEW